LDPGSIPGTSTINGGETGFDRAESESRRFGVVLRKQPKALDANDDIYLAEAA